MARYSSLLILLFLLACGDKQTKKSISSSTAKVVQARGFVVPADSMSPPLIVPLKNPKVTALQPPTVVPTHTNVHAAQKPQVKDCDLSALKKVTPGLDTIPMPKIVTAVDSPFIPRQPEPTASLPARMKDGAVYNIQYLDVDQGLASSYVRCILEDRTGNIWLATYGAGVCKFDGKAFTNYTDKDGLGNNTVWTIFEDKRGNIWFGTNGGGVIRYDGKYFTRFTLNEGLSSNTVWSIAEDKSGNLWFGTGGGGVSKYNGNCVDDILIGTNLYWHDAAELKKNKKDQIKHFVHYTTKEGLSNNTVWTILQDRKGNMWFGTYGGSVCKFDGKSFTHYTKAAGLGSNTVLSMHEDKSGHLWFGTFDSGVCKFDGKSFYQYSTKEGLSNNTVWSIYEDKSGNLWFGTYGGGVSKFNGNCVDDLLRKDRLYQHSPHEIENTKTDTLKTFTHYTESEGLSGNYIWFVREDQSGNLWLGTNGNGVSRFARKSFKHFTTKEGLAGNAVCAICEDKEKNLWFGTNGAGISRYDGKSFTQYTVKEGLSNNSIMAITEDRSGNIWIGADGGGVTKYDGKSFAFYSDKEALSEHVVLKIFEDRAGNLWFCTNGGGVSKFDGKSFTRYTTKQGLSSNYVWSVIEDRSGNLWFGTFEGGITKFDGKSFTRYTEKEGLANNTVWTILEDKAGNIWFATYGGIIKFDGKYFTQYTEKEGLTSNTVWSLIIDRSENMWMSTEKGLSCFRACENKGQEQAQPCDISARLTTFHKEDGLKAEDFFRGSAVLDSKNRLWLGSGKALTMLDMNEFEFNTATPDVQLENIYLQENFLDYHTLMLNRDTLLRREENEYLSKVKFNSVASFQNYPKQLELPYNTNHLTFKFCALDWYAPHKLKYQYKLEGLDKNWSNISEYNKADYRNIPFGKYTFKVKAIGSAQRWSKTFEYPFIVHPPWWQTWWAYTAYALLAVGIVCLIVWLNTRRLIARGKELNIKINEATAEIIKQKSEVEKQKEAVEKKNKEIEEKQIEILDSIRYARRIQTSLLPSDKYIEKVLKNLREKRGN